MLLIPHKKKGKIYILINPVSMGKRACNFFPDELKQGKASRLTQKVSNGIKMFCETIARSCFVLFSLFSLLSEIINHENKKSSADIETFQTVESWVQVFRNKELWMQTGDHKNNRRVSTGDDANEACCAAENLERFVSTQATAVRLKTRFILLGPLRLKPHLIIKKLVSIRTGNSL